MYEPSVSRCPCILAAYVPVPTLLCEHHNQRDQPPATSHQPVTLGMVTPPPCHAQHDITTMQRYSAHISPSEGCIVTIYCSHFLSPPDYLLSIVPRRHPWLVWLVQVQGMCSVVRLSRGVAPAQATTQRSTPLPDIPTPLLHGHCCHQPQPYQQCDTMAPVTLVTV